MSRTLACLALAAVAPFMTPKAADGQAPVSMSPPKVSEAPLQTGNRTLRASLERIAKGSPLWREAVERVRKTGRYAIILTPDQVAVADASKSAGTDHFDLTVLAEASPLPPEGSRVDVVMVVVNLALLEEVHAAARSLPGELLADLDRILVHEIYGHALPYLLAGDRSGRCADPFPSDRAADACSIRRENAVRAELRLGRRVDYGLEGLALSRRGPLH